MFPVTHIYGMIVEISLLRNQFSLKNAIFIVVFKTPFNSSCSALNHYCHGRKRTRALEDEHWTFCFYISKSYCNTMDVKRLERTRISAI